MKNSAVRISLLLLAVVAAVITTYLIADLERRTSAERAAQQVAREGARALLASIGELKAGQRGYVAAGQGHHFWTARVTQTLQSVDLKLRELRNTTHSDGAGSALDTAAMALDNFKKLDTRAQEYVSLGQQLLASDLIFSDGLEITGTAIGQIEHALNAELQWRDQNLVRLRRREAVVAAAGGGALLLVVLLLAPLAGRKSQITESRALNASPVKSVQSDTTGAADVSHTLPSQTEPAPDFNAAARLCTEFGRVMATSEVPPLLARAAEILDATGLVIWISDRTGSELRPVLSHGYSDKVMARMRAIPTDAQNAAAAAFRSSQLRVVANDDATNGAVVVPMVTPAGCIGVLAAELRRGGERRESTHALATILAAQLATLVGAAPSTGAVQAQG